MNKERWQLVNITSVYILVHSEFSCIYCFSHCVHVHLTRHYLKHISNLPLYYLTNRHLPMFEQWQLFSQHCLFFINHLKPQFLLKYIILAAFDSHWPIQNKDLRWSQTEVLCHVKLTFSARVENALTWLLTSTRK